MWKRSTVVTALVVSAIASGCARAPRARLSPCALADVEGPARCGVLMVPEARTARGGREIPIRFVILPASSAARAADAVFIVVGGPGQGAVSNAGGYARLLAGLRAGHDLVLVDQRGTGGSRPLDCDLYHGTPAGYLGDFLPLSEVRQCRDSLERVADLARYTTADAAADLDAVRSALGYDRLNLEAASYGTRVALEYLRRHGDRVRAAVLRSVSPPWMRQPSSFARDAQAALDSLIADCRADERCHAEFPRFGADVQDALARVERDTVRVSAGESPASQRSALRRGPFGEKLRLLLYSPEVSQYVPLAMHRAAAGDFELFAELAAEVTRVIDAQVSIGMYLTVTCAEDVPEIPIDSARREASGTFLGGYRLDQQRAACASWPRARVATDYSDPVAASAPVLLISSAIDPITPPRWAASVAASLPNSRHVVLPRAGHSPSSACVMGIVTAFIERPEPAALDVRCAEQPAGRPPFAVAPP